MSDVPNTIRDERELSDQEGNLLRWLLERGDERARGFLPQIGDARVVARCGCGCASVDFSVRGTEPDRSHGLETLGDEFFWKDDLGSVCGIFILAASDLLATLETYSVDGEGTAALLPDPDQLQRESWFAGGG